MKSLLQTKVWADFRQSQGWQIHWVGEILVLEKALPMGFSFLYAPELILASFQDKAEELQVLLKKQKAIFLRLDFLDQYEEEGANLLKEKGFRKAFEEIQPEYRQWVDLAPEEEQILAQMKEKGRYNIRLAQRRGVVVKKSDQIDEFYDLFRQTAARDGFQIRPRAYFVKLWRLLQENNYGELLVAYWQNQPVAAEIVTYFDSIASYLYGASGNAYREVMAPYLLHWEAIKEAKRRNCQIYDLLAISPFSEKPKAESGKHKYAGITRFKEQFGGRKVQLLGSYDLVFRPFWYNLFKIAEKIRRH